VGRKNLYDSLVVPYLDKIPEWYGFMTEAQIAETLGVSSVTWNKYKNAHPELRACLKKGKVELVAELRSTLKKKAKGFYYDETKTYHKTDRTGDTDITETYHRYAQPDTGAIHLLLKNLDETWRNDDQTTVDMKQQKLDLDKAKSENENW